MGPEHNEVWALPGCGLAFSLGERHTLASDALPGVQPRFRDDTNGCPTDRRLWVRQLPPPDVQ